MITTTTIPMTTVTVMATTIRMTTVTVMATTIRTNTGSRVISLRSGR